ncbi:MAG: serine/threonine-protein phosphatase [Planctomycetaceae bacterium]|nr:serine/threonine-protein phosphatase [Planctomycetaceae bacterium]
MRWEQQVQYASQTDIGLRRKNNEDTVTARLAVDETEYDARGHLFLVADGMGGHAVGELASKIAAETVPHTFFKVPEGTPAQLLMKAIRAANESIHQRGTQNRDFQRMGTTCTTMVLTSGGLLIGHVGDSRAYRIRRDRIDQLTFDHSLVWEIERRNPQAATQFNLAEHKNVITRSLGPEPEIEIDLEGPYPIFPGDIYVLCTDGLSGQVTDEEIGSIVRELSPSQACRLLVHLANLRGGADNCTVQIMRIGELPANVPAKIVEPPHPETGLGWSWLIAFWIAALLIVSGLSLLMFRHPLEGTFVTAIGGIGLVALVWMVWNRRPTPVQGDGSDASRTNYWRPYRTAVAKTSEQLLNELVQLETAVQRAAHEEQWNVDWNAHRQAIEAAQKAAEQKRYTKAVRDIARAIDLLMSDLGERD